MEATATIPRISAVTKTNVTVDLFAKKIRVQVATLYPLGFSGVEGDRFEWAIKKATE